MLRAERHGDVALWTIARPQAKNALDQVTLEGLAEAVATAAGDRTLRAAILTGEGGVFAAGGDLRELRGKDTVEDAERFAETGTRLCRNIASLGLPVIAALSGVAFGGGAELAVACDLRIAEASARISFKQVRLGVTTAWGTLGDLVALVGQGAAMRLLLTAEEVSAPEARSMGLVDATCADGESGALALQWAQEIARGAPEAVARMKELVRRASAPPADLTRLERASFVHTWTSPDHTEAVTAYFERRAPRWRPW